jgi:hypothetical protein
MALHPFFNMQSAMHLRNGHSPPFSSSDWQSSMHIFNCSLHLMLSASVYAGRVAQVLSCRHHDSGQAVGLRAGDRAAHSLIHHLRIACRIHVVDQIIGRRAL